MRPSKSPETRLVLQVRGAYRDAYTLISISEADFLTMPLDKLLDLYLMPAAIALRARVGSKRGSQQS